MKAVLLDRDGVINALVYHSEAGVIDAPFTLSQFELLPGVPEAIRQLKPEPAPAAAPAYDSIGDDSVTDEPAAD